MRVHKNGCPPIYWREESLWQALKDAFDKSQNKRLEELYDPSFPSPMHVGTIIRLFKVLVPG